VFGLQGVKEMSQTDKVRVICGTLQAALTEPVLARQLQMIQDAKVLFDSVHNEIWHQHIRQQAKKNERDWA
jgi:hypothetical protein